MRPSLRQLEYLVAIADTGSFGDAATRVGVSQPSLSIQIRDMETYLGVILVERGRQGALLTPIGTELTKRARIILQAMTEFRIYAKDAEGNLSGVMKLGVLPTVGPYLLPQTTKRLHTEFPQLRLIVGEGGTADLREGLDEGRYDAVISTPEDHPGARSMPIVREQLFICTAPDDALAAQHGPVKLKDLKGRELLRIGDGHKFAIIVQKLADAAGAFTSSTYQGTSLDATRQMAAMGDKIAILPSLYVISETKRDPDLIVRPIEHRIAQRQISLIWRHASPLSEKFKAIGEALRLEAQHTMQQIA